MQDKDMSVEVPDGEEFPTVDTNEEWVNYGDVNPKGHGGCFIRWVPEREMWKVVNTSPPNVLPDEVAQGRHMVEVEWVEMQDLFDGGDPENGPTDFLEGSINSLCNVDSYLHALVDFDIEYFVADWIHYRADARHKWWDDGEYWDRLAGEGVDVDDYRD